MKKFFLILFLGTCFSFELFAQTARSTSFDDRPTCEEVKGVWRQFGNGCTDDCRSKFDEFTICTQALNYGCDCGKNRCWNGETCVTQKSFKRIFDAEKEKEKAKLAEAKRRRQAVAQENQDVIMSKLINKIAIDNEATDLANINKANAASAAASMEIRNAPQEIIAAPPPPVVQNITQQRPSTAATTTSSIPPFFAQQEEKKAQQMAAEAAAKAAIEKALATGQAANPQATTTTKSTKEDPLVLTLPGLPVIPLPGS